MVNVVVKPDLYQAHRELYRGEPLLAVRGVLERKARRVNLVAEEAWPLTELLPEPVKNRAALAAHQAIQQFEAPPSHNYR